MLLPISFLAWHDPRVCMAKHTSFLWTTNHDDGEARLQGQLPGNATTGHIKEAIGLFSTVHFEFTNKSLETEPRKHVDVSEFPVSPVTPALTKLISNVLSKNH